MFTGLIQGTGQLATVQARGAGKRLRVTTPFESGSFVLGESIAINGVCLTVVASRGPEFEADVIPETCQVTTLGQARTGQRVNLERALRVGDRLGGHWVQGHVDGVAQVREVASTHNDYRMRVELPKALRRFVAHKGSIALDGVSLTVARVAETEFEVALIPETLAQTTLGQLRRGVAVNVEVDLLARYLDRLFVSTPPQHGKPDPTADRET